MNRTRTLLLALALTLAQAPPMHAVDGVLEINHACAVNTGCFPGDTAGYPVSITTAGSYRLTSSLQGRVGVSAERVTLDLNGFTISSTGAAAISGGSFVTVRNGNVERASGVGDAVSLGGMHGVLEGVRVNGRVNMGDQCRVTDSWVFFSGCGNIDLGDDCRLQRNHITGSGCGTLIVAGDRAIVDDNHLSGDEGTLSAGPGARITNNTFDSQRDSVSISSSFAVVTGNTLQGIPVDSTGISCTSCVVENNTVWGHSSFGLVDSSGTTAYEGNVFEANNGGNTNPQVSGGIETSPNVCGANTTCP